MSKVYKANGSVADAWIAKDLGSGHPEVWTTFNVRIDAASLAQWISNLHTQGLLDLFDAGSVDLLDNVLVTNDPAWQTGWSSPAGVPAGDVVLLVELRHVTSGPTELYINGVLVVSATDLSGIDTQIIRLGQSSVSGSAPSLVYYANVLVGTTRGASDLFADDFSSGNFSAWTTEVGSVSVIDDPTTVPAAPVLLSATPGDTTVDLAWSTPADGGLVVSGYKVYRGTTAGGETLHATLGLVNVFHDTGLTDGVAYFYKVSALNALGESARSNELSATPRPLAWTNEGPQLTVEVAPGLNPGSFTLARRLGIGEARASFDPLVVESQQTQAFNVRLVQHGASAVTEIYSVDIDLRPLPSSLLGETA